MIALYLGEIDIEKIYEITYPFYVSLIQEIGIMFHFESSCAFNGNSNINGKDLSEMIQKANPFNADMKKQKSKRVTFETLFNTPFGKGR